MLNANCGTTQCIIGFLAKSLDHTRIAAKESFLLTHLRTIVFKALSDAYLVDGGLALDIPEYGSLGVTNSGNVSGVKVFISNSHRNIVASFGAQWNSMAADGSLRTSWPDNDNDEIAIVDLMVFVFMVMKVRRSQCKRPWTGTSLDVLKKLRDAVIRFMTATVNNAASVYAMQNRVLNRAIPSRSMQRLLSAVLKN